MESEKHSRKWLASRVQEMWSKFKMNWVLVLLSISMGASLGFSWSQLKINKLVFRRFELLEEFEKHNTQLNKLLAQEVQGLREKVRKLETKLERHKFPDLNS